jgi:hypothetical protein
LSAPMLARPISASRRHRRRVPQGHARPAGSAAHLLKLAGLTTGLLLGLAATANDTTLLVHRTAFLIHFRNKSVEGCNEGVGALQ